MKWSALRNFLDKLGSSAAPTPSQETQVIRPGSEDQTGAAGMAIQAQRYRLEKRLGGGGMGEVWLATDTLLDRPIAIKYLKATQDARYKELFLSEARILAQTNHPNITLIYDAVFDEQHKGFYLVMEYVEGKPLSDVIAGQAGPIPLDMALEVAIGVLQALDYAHGKGIVHRDIKPANVILQEAGVKLTDFGVAGLMSLLTEGSDQIVGTPSYMSPEQIEGAALDGRADLYSLGVMLYEMVTSGRLPFEGDSTVALFQAHLNMPPPPLSQFSADTPPALEQTVMQLLAKEPEARYPSAGAALAVFKAIQARQRLEQPHLDLLDAEAKPLVNRTGELARMEQLWTDVRRSARPRLLVVKGPKGIGKSKLVTAFLGRFVIDQEFVGLAGVFDTAGGPYAPFAEILATIINKGLARKAASQERVDRLVAHMPGLARLLALPGSTGAQKELEPPAAPKPTGSGIWQTLSNKVSQAASAPPPEIRQELFSAVLDILAEPGPAVIFLEKAAALDEASAALAGFLIHQQQLPLLIVAACRDTGAAPSWLDAFSADEKVVISVPPLPEQAVKEHLAYLVDGAVSDVVVESVMERSQGNPLQVEEITHRLIDSGEIQPDENGLWRYVAREMAAPEDAFLPKAVLSAFTRRLARLSESSREALTLAALSEPSAEFDFERWVLLLGGESQRELARQTLEEAETRRLVRQVAEGRYAFRVADIDKVLTAALPDTRRRDLHRHMAETLRRGQADFTLIRYHEEQA